MPEFKRSACPVACLLDIVGDKWTLLVVRDLVLGKSTYKEFEQSPESIPTNILADRLKRLEQAGVIKRSRYQERPVRYAYQLSQKGLDLRPILGEMIKWSNKHIPGTLNKKQIEKLIQQNIKNKS